MSSIKSIIFLLIVNTSHIHAYQWPHYQHSVTKVQLCYQCPPGYYHAGECEVDRKHNPGYSKCRKCTGNQFTASWGLTQNCWDRHTCPEGEKVLYDGRNTGPVLCDCELNKMRTAANGQCMEAVLKTEYDRLSAEYDKVLKKLVEAEKERDECKNKPTAKCKPCSFPTSEKPKPSPTSSTSTTIAPKAQNTTDADTTDSCKVPVMIGCGITVSIMPIFLILFCRCKPKDICGRGKEFYKKGTTSSYKNDETKSSRSEEVTSSDPVDDVRVNLLDVEPTGDHEPSSGTKHNQDTKVDIEPKTSSEDDSKRNLKTDSEGIDCSSGAQPFMESKAAVFEMDEKESVREDIDFIDENPGDDLKANRETVDDIEQDRQQRLELDDIDGNPQADSRANRETPHDVEQDRKKRLDHAFRIIEMKVTANSLQFNRQVLELHTDVCTRIESEGHTSVYAKVVAGLREWKGVLGAEATVGRLIDQLKRCGRKDIADEIRAKLSSELGYAQHLGSASSDETTPPLPHHNRDDLLDQAFSIFERLRRSGGEARQFFREYLKLDSNSVNALPRDIFVSYGLALWRRKKGHQATIEVFCSLLRDAEAYDIVDEIEDTLLNPIRAPSSNTTLITPSSDTTLLNDTHPSQRSTEHDGSSQHGTVPKQPMQPVQPVAGNPMSSTQASTSRSNLATDESGRIFDEGEEQEEKCKDDAKVFEDMDLIDEKTSGSSKSSGSDKQEEGKKKQRCKEGETASARPKRSH